MRLGTRGWAVTGRGWGVESATKDPNMNEAGLDVLGRSSPGSTSLSQHTRPTCTRAGAVELLERRLPSRRSECSGAARLKQSRLSGVGMGEAQGPRARGGSCPHVGGEPRSLTGARTLKSHSRSGQPGAPARNRRREGGGETQAESVCVCLCICLRSSTLQTCALRSAREPPEAL